MEILMPPTSSQSIGLKNIDSTQSNISLQTSSTEGINQYIDAEPIVIPQSTSEWLIPGEVQTGPGFSVGGGKLKKIYVITYKKKTYIIDASSQVNALNKVCKNLKLTSGSKIMIQKKNDKRKNMIHTYYIN